MSVERPFDLVLFDLDGTLIDSASQLALAVNRTLTDLGLPEADEAPVGGKRADDWSVSRVGQ